MMIKGYIIKLESGQIQDGQISFKSLKGENIIGRIQSCIRCISDNSVSNK